MRSASVAPDLSSSGERVSDTVSTAIRSGTNDFDSSMLGMKPLRSNLEDLTRGRPSGRARRSALPTGARLLRTRPGILLHRSSQQKQPHLPVKNLILRSPPKAGVSKDGQPTRSH